MKRWLIQYCMVALALVSCSAEKGGGRENQKKNSASSSILPGAYDMQAYLPMLKGKACALVINQTATIGNASLLDTLLKRSVEIRKVFVPEHGLRGTADAGAHLDNGLDSATGIAVISLYGDNKKPKKEQLEDIDIVIYDLQDVGVRFYTYISTLEYVMEACSESDKMLIVLDRPDPNGHYVDGPVLETVSRSFVGMQRIPLVYGMTVGEYAQMLRGERWIDGADQLALQVIPCINYDHTKRYALPVAPSPNLKNMAAVYLYPSLCLFEGTVVSVGRGTDKPFQQWGHPLFAGKATDSFVPVSTIGASKPLYEGKACYGRLLTTDSYSAFHLIDGRLHLEWLMQAYQWYPDKGHFFNSFFEKLAGTTKLEEQIKAGLDEKAIRKSWESDLTTFKKIRKKYLLYKDFE